MNEVLPLSSVLLALLVASCSSPPPDDVPSGCADSFVNVNWRVGNATSPTACAVVDGGIYETYSYWMDEQPSPQCRYEGVQVRAVSAAGDLYVAIDVSNDVFAHTGGANLYVRINGTALCPDTPTSCFGQLCSFDITQAGPVGSDVTARLHGPCTMTPPGGGDPMTIDDLVLHGRLAKRTREVGAETAPPMPYEVYSDRCPQ